MAAANIHRHIVLTGPPGIGKTTLIHKACEAIKLAGIKAQGFYTEELRERGHRIGFDIITLDGQRGPLARIAGDEPGNRRQYRVGQYVVQLQAFEQVALPSLRKKEEDKHVYIIDEVGKRELFSASFVQIVRDLLKEPTNTILTTIPIAKGRPIQLVEEIRSNKEAIVFQISRENRDHILKDIVQTVISSQKKFS